MGLDEGQRTSQRTLTQNTSRPGISYSFAEARLQHLFLRLFVPRRDAVAWKIVGRLHKLQRNG